MNIEALLLQEQPAGDPQAVQTVQKLVEFVHAAKTRIRLAAYHFAFKDPALAGPVAKALKDAAAKGVEVQIAYYYEHQRDSFSLGGGPRPTGTEAFLQKLVAGTDIAIKPIHGSHLMHNKYILRDGHTSNAAVWTGSTNFTDGAFKFMENNVVIVKSAQLSTFYENDFSELWNSGSIAGVGTGVSDFGTAQVGSAAVDVYFSPGEGRTMDAEIVGYLRSARKRIKISSMVLSSPTILAALSEAVDQQQAGGISGIYDESEMADVKKDWAKSPVGGSRLALFEHVAGQLVGKPSRRYDAQHPDADYNFMHNKIAVCDDVVITGSFNFSRNAESNAENLLAIHSRAWADKYADYIDQIVSRYRGSR